MKKVMFLIVVCSLMLVATSSAQATIIKVDDDYTPATPGWWMTAFNSIQAAIFNAPPYSEIYVKKGTYNEQLLINKPLYIKGDGPEKTQIVSFVDGGAVQIEVGNVFFSGFSITNVKSTIGIANGGIFVDSSTNCFISNCKIKTSDFGIYVYDSTDITIHSVRCNHFEAVDGIQVGIILFYSDECVIHKCLTKSFHGIAVYNSDNNYLSENRCNYGGRGIVSACADGNEIVDNICAHNEYEGISMTESGDDMLGNRLEGNICIRNETGITLYDSQYTLVLDNFCAYNDDYGIEIKTESHHNDIMDNTIAYNGYYGLHLYNSFPDVHDQKIVNNTFIANNSGYCQASDSGNNNYWDDGVSGNYWSDLTGPDTDDDGIVDIPYELVGSEGAVDNFPLVSEP